MPSWQVGPTEPALFASTVDVWRADLENVDHRLSELLTHPEQERAELISRAPQREMWQRSRCVLRALLARYVQADPRELRIAVGAHGKPELTPRAGEPARLWFNLSHSGSVALYALSCDGPVGVDVEHAHGPDERAERKHVAIAARMFGAEQAERLAALDGELREREFLTLWTRHEAELKCRGTGIGAPSAAPSGETPPWLAGLDVGPGAAAALACAVAPRELRLWDWR